MDKPFVKAMLVGDSKAGKTSSLVSLVEAGYKLRFLDMDCKLVPSFFQQTLKKRSPGMFQERVQYVQFRDTYITTGTGTLPKSPATAYLNACRATTKWPIDESKPAEWGPEYVFVVDTLNLLSIAAFNQAQTIAPDTRDARQWYKAAGSAVEAYLGGLWGDSFKTNVLVLSHITDIELETEIVKDRQGNIQRQAKPGSPVKGFPTTIGQALSKHIAKYSNELWLLETTGVGDQVKRVLRTSSTGRIDLGSAAVDLPKSLPADTALATLFSLLTEL